MSPLVLVLSPLTAALSFNTLCLIFCRIKAWVVWSGREESCRVSSGLLCLSDPTAVLDFASPSGFAWLLSLPETCKYSLLLLQAFQVPSCLPEKVCALETKPLSIPFWYPKYAEHIFSKILLKNRKNRNRLLPCINIMYTSGVRWLPQLPSGDFDVDWRQQTLLCVNMDISAILSRAIGTLVTEEHWDSVLLDSQYNVNTVFPT